MQTESIATEATTPALIERVTRVIRAKSPRGAVGSGPSERVTESDLDGALVHDLPVCVTLPSQCETLRASLTARAYRGDESGVWGLMVRDSIDTSGCAVVPMLPDLTDDEITTVIDSMGW